MIQRAWKGAILSVYEEDNNKLMIHRLLAKTEGISLWETSKQEILFTAKLLLTESGISYLKFDILHAR